MTVQLSRSQIDFCLRLQSVINFTDRLQMDNLSLSLCALIAGVKEGLRLAAVWNTLAFKSF